MHSLGYKLQYFCRNVSPFGQYQSICNGFERYWYPCWFVWCLSRRFWDIAQPHRLRSGLQLHGIDAYLRFPYGGIKALVLNFRRRPRPNRKFDSTLAQGYLLCNLCGGGHLSLGDECFSSRALRVSYFDWDLSRCFYLQRSRLERKTLTTAILLLHFSAMLCVFVGLIARFSEFVQLGVKISMGGLVIGLLFYISALCVSYGAGGQAEINGQRRNWHWLELTGFVIFMYFAPETLREVLSA